MPVCCCCGYEERHGVIFGRVDGKNSFACERCATHPYLWFPFRVPTYDGYNRFLFAFMERSPTSRILKRLPKRLVKTRFWRQRRLIPIDRQKLDEYE